MSSMSTIGISIFHQNFLPMKLKASDYAVYGLDHSSHPPLDRGYNVTGQHLKLFDAGDILHLNFSLWALSLN